MITDKHILKEAIQKPLSPGGKPMNVRRAVVIHATFGATAQSSIDWWKQPAQKKIDLGAHIIIDRDGTIYQCRPFNKTISHAGRSRWDDPKTGRHYDSCNGFTIGIELANAGDDLKVIKIARKLPGFAGTVMARHRNGGDMKEWEKFSDEQYKACVSVVEQLVGRYNLDDITSHQEISPERKSDVGPAFNLKQLREDCGFSGLPAVHWP